MKHADLLPLLMPPVSYDRAADALIAQLSAEGSALDAAMQSAITVLDAITPYGAGAMLPDWERVLGLTPAAGATTQQRIDAAVAKVAQVGGLSIPYFTQLAAQLGYTIAIAEPQPARAGTSRAGDAMWITDIIWVWQVNVSGTALVRYQASAGTASAGDPITSYQDPVIEQVLNDLKPAFTYVQFTYGR
ncbi:YmfQ family protein [Paludibacterium yongneupense]|uniref:YmfQ family protein n=1 Tax=Paludibacterium yongneupense TaxID=400061 RepID=UPI0004161D96|nr:putative phage tail protein [Paludibacterium yongneupense]